MRTSFVVMLLVLCSLLLSGCWNRRELNELAVSVAIGLDKSDKGILLSNQILNAGAISEQHGSNLATVNLFQEEGQSVQEAGRKMTTKSTKKIYVGQLQMLVLGEDFAKEGVAHVLDHISRDHEYRTDFYVIVARNILARDILKVFTPLEKTPATRMQNSLEVSSAVWGETSAVEFREFISGVISNGREAVLSGMAFQGSITEGNSIDNVGKIYPGARLGYAGLAVFKEDKLIGWLNVKESIGYNFTQGNIKSTVLVLPCPNSRHVISVELMHTKSKMTASFEKGRPVVHIAVKAEGVVSDAQCQVDLTNPSTINQIKKASNARIKSNISAVVNKMQHRFNSDIFGFGELFWRKYPGYWKKHQQNWYEIFPTIEVSIQPDVHVRQMFKTTKSIEERMKE